MNTNDRNAVSDDTVPAGSRPADPKNPAGRPHGTTSDQILEMESEGQAAKPGTASPAVSSGGHPPAAGEPATSAPPHKDHLGRPGAVNHLPESLPAPDAPGSDGPALSPQNPSSMPRAEDDAEVHAHSPEFNDAPGSGRHRGEKKPDRR